MKYLILNINLAYWMDTICQHNFNTKNNYILSMYKFNVICAAAIMGFMPPLLDRGI